MIARRWRGWVGTDRAEDYVGYLDQTGLSEYPEDDDFLVGERETTVQHFRVPWAHPRG